MAEKSVLKPYDLILIGEWIATLKNALGQSVTSWDSVKGCLMWLSTVLKDVENLAFIGEEAETLLNVFKTKYWKDNTFLEPDDRPEFQHPLSRWEGRLQEISKNWILSYPDTHIDVSKLREGAKAFLSSDEFNTLESLERQGLNEATSSLLFNNFTSAEFLALRTAESLLKKWYEKKTGRKLGRTTWGEVLEKLNQEFPKEERPKELLLLDYLRERRNEVAHPEAVSNSVAASTTFLNVISLCKSLHPYIHPTWVKKQD